MARNVFARFFRKIRRFHLLPSQDRGLLIEAALLPLFVTTSFRAIGVPRTQSCLRRWALARQLKSSLSEIGAANSAQVRIQRTLGIGGTCLTRSLTLWTMLLRRGVETDLKVGFRKLEGKFEGHAWLEYQGTVLNENERVVAGYETSKDRAEFDRQLLMRRSKSSWR